jgi:hypothetical protein
MDRPTAAPEGRREAKPVAAVITHWRTNSHADVLLSRILEPEAWGHPKPFALTLAAVYADQFPPDDLCRPYCQKHGVPIFPSVRGAVGVGTRGVPVEGVLVIGEHGNYPTNARGQKLYPRRRLFEEVVDAFRFLGRRVPVFNDKHLSYDTLSARWMVDLARHEGIPFMAGSSIPVAWRDPPLALPVDCDLREALSVGYSDIEAYGFHALEGLQCMIERRRERAPLVGVQCLSGPAAWDALKSDLATSRLLQAALRAKHHTPDALKRAETRPGPRDALFVIRFADGFRPVVAMIDSLGAFFGFAGRVGADEPVATIFALEDRRPFGHFGHLLRAIEHMVLTGRPAYPIERTLLTTGLLDALLQSRSLGGIFLPTPHLSALSQYAPADWPFAPGASGTAA